MKVFFICAISLTIQVISVSCRDQGAPKVTLKHGGSLEGSTVFTIDGRKVNAFLGIPYAEPPIGSLRFKPPQPIKPWTGTKPATTPPHDCIQIDVFGEDKSVVGSEDCLYLNVYTPHRHTGKNLPVMVWIHGFIFSMGTTDPAVLGPDLLLVNDIILVTFNYRLGPLGFLSLGTADAPGNYGLKDQLLVLQWIKENIRSFGGNPNDITLSGHSAGSASVSMHMVSRKSKGLFHKAILQAGTMFDVWGMVDISKSMERLKDVSEMVGCSQKSNDNEQLLDCLTDVEATDLVKASASFQIDDRYRALTIFGPVVEPDGPDAFLPENPRNVIDSHGDSIPIIIGYNSEEGVFTSTPILNQHERHFKKNLNSVLPKLLYYDCVPDYLKRRITKRIDKFYFKGNHDWTKRNHRTLTNLFTDRLIAFSTDQFLRTRFSTFKTVAETYVYVFDHKGPTSVTEIIGAGPEFFGISHGDELPYLFPQNQLDVAAAEADEVMKWAMPKMWTDFVRKWNPTPRKSCIRQHWIPSNKFPVKYIKIGDKYDTSKYSDDSLKFLYRAFNVSDIHSTDYASNGTEIEIGKAEHYENHSLTDSGRSIESNESNINESNGNNDSDSEENKPCHKILKNKKGLLEKRMEFWRSLERFLTC